MVTGCLNIYNSILEREKLNGMPEEVIEKARKLFEERYHNVDWKNFIFNI